MEATLHVRTPAEATASLDEAMQWEQSPKLRPYLDAITPRLKQMPVTRVSYGTEFCENLLPSPASLSEIRAASNRPFTLLTPYVGDRGLSRIRELLPALQPSDEVVFNDWGVLNVLRRQFPSLVPVQGRLMMKSLRDPRVMSLYGEARPDPALKVLQGSNLDNKAYVAMLSRFGVRLAGIDGLPQGNDFKTAGIGLTAYLPFGFISTARACQAAGLGYSKESKFQPGAPCRHECQTFLLEHTYTNSPFENRDQKFWLVGNTYFYLHPPAMVESLLAACADGRLARIEVQPRLPMLVS